VANVRADDNAPEDEDDEEPRYGEYSDPDSYDRNGASDGLGVYSDADPGL
jgi:hypothetical protein